MTLHRLQLRPLSPWCSHWQADTLFGLLCWTCARTDGTEVLHREIIGPALAGQPPFVVSDACPDGFLPLPTALKAQRVPWSAADRKTVRKARWITRAGFRQFQRGELPSSAALHRTGGIRESAEFHNLISRESNTTSDGGRLFAVPTMTLGEQRRLTVFARIVDGYESRFFELMQCLATYGFGADASVGKGEFEVASDLEPDPELDDVATPNAVTVLSTFQPAVTDPTEGFWESFVKFGKLGPDFGLENIFKRPMLLLRPGACFWTGSPLRLVGRAIPMPDLLAHDVVAELLSRGTELVHPAFGLTVPVQWPVLADR
ncbi:MAG: hypothetical protein IAG10_20285 [Planctomycetaceae bacterium]|nr:hypothetical protein [Planctomycetaceae bacterium]